MNLFMLLSCIFNGKFAKCFASGKILYGSKKVPSDHLVDGGQDGRWTRGEGGGGAVKDEG